MRFELREGAGGDRRVRTLQMSAVGRPGPAQTSTVGDMDPVAAGEEFFLATADVNFDGYQDLYLLTDRGTANATADYWLFDPAARAFRRLGNYPVFRLDAARHRLSTCERGGHAGLIYEKK